MKVVRICPFTFTQLEVHLEVTCSVPKLDQYIYEMFSISGGLYAQCHLFSPALCYPPTQHPSLSNTFLLIYSFLYSLTVTISNPTSEPKIYYTRIISTSYCNK